MKDLVITASKGYSFDAIRPWVESLRRVAPNVDIVVMTAHSDRDTRVELAKRNIIPAILSCESDRQGVVVTRFRDMADYLAGKQYRYVIAADIRDVIFQSNPFEWMEQHMGPYEIVVGSECIQYKNETLWGADNFTAAFDDDTFEQHKDNVIYCAGVIGGTCSAMVKLMDDIYNHSVGRPTFNPDQAVMNMLLHTPEYDDRTLFATQASGFVCHAGTVAASERMDVFRPHLVESEPKLVNGEVISSTGRLFSIVHQYDTTGWNLRKIQ